MKTMFVQLMLVIAVVAGSVSIAAAQWTSVGSTGTVDEADLDVFEMSGSQVRIRSTATLPATVVVRYNVVAAEGVVGGFGIGWHLRYRDNGAGARVVAVLRQFNFVTGVTTNVLTFDSNAFAPSPNFQTQGVTNCNASFNFSTNAYFVEVTLTQSSVAGTPALQAIQAGFIVCVP